MQKLTTSLIGLLLLLIAPMAMAVSAPAVEPGTSIIRTGRDLEWSQQRIVPHPYAAEQREFQAWMRETYDAWLSSWEEPLDAEEFAREKRLVRQILTAAHRRAVRTGEWHVRPTLAVGKDWIAEVRTTEQLTVRPSRRAIVREAHERAVRQMLRFQP